MPKAHTLHLNRHATLVNFMIAYNRLKNVFFREIPHVLHQMVAIWTQPSSKAFGLLLVHYHSCYFWKEKNPCMLFEAD